MYEVLKIKKLTLLVMILALIMSGPAAAVCRYCGTFNENPACFDAITWEQIPMSSNDCELVARCFGSPPFQFCRVICITPWDECRLIVV